MSAGHDNRRLARGFTLVELLVAVTASMIAAMGVFAMARHSVATFAAESRMGDSQLNAAHAFERVRADVARAGMLVTPNIQSDPKRCGPAPTTDYSALAELAAVQVEPDYTNENGIVADRLTLAGSYGSYEQFLVADIDPGTHTITLVREGADARLRERGTPADVFQEGSILRLVSPEHKEQYAIITSVVGGETPDSSIQLTVTGTPLMHWRDSGYICGLHGLNTGWLVNPVNIIRYEVRSLDGVDGYQSLYTDAPVGNVYDDPASRMELVRYEVDAYGAEVPGTVELIAEYAVGFDVGAQVVDQTGATPTVRYVDSDDPDFLSYLGPLDANNITGPQHVRGLRTRLSVRSRQADRTADVAPEHVSSGAPSRIQMSDDPPRFARVRTVQSDIALNNLHGVTWQ